MFFYFIKSVYNLIKYCSKNTINKVLNKTLVLCLPLFISLFYIAPIQWYNDEIFYSFLSSHHPAPHLFLSFTQFVSLLWLSLMAISENTLSYGCLEPPPTLTCSHSHSKHYGWWVIRWWELSHLNHSFNFCILDYILVACLSSCLDSRLLNNLSSLILYTVYSLFYLSELPHLTFPPEGAHQEP